MKKFYTILSNVKLILACQEVLKWVYPSLNQKKVAFQSNTNTTSKHAPQVERDCWYCMQDNQHKIIEKQTLDKKSHWDEGLFYYNTNPCNKLHPSRLVTYILRTILCLDSGASVVLQLLSMAGKSYRKAPKLQAPVKTKPTNSFVWLEG